MIRLLTLVFALLSVMAAPLTAQTDEEVQAARLLHIDGEFEAALEVLLPAAENGHPVAQNVVGVSYEQGMGVAQDIDTAIGWYQAAIDQGLGKAMHNLGVIYQHGRHGRTGRHAEARALFERAVEAGYVGSYSNLGMMLSAGLGGEADPARALELYREGEKLDDPFCINNLAHFYREGELLEQDFGHARLLYGRAAVLGLSDGFNNLGAMHDNGLGGAEDTRLAAMLYRKAMTMGNTQSAINLSELIQEGRIPGQEDEAAAFCLWAAQRGADIADACDGLMQGLDDATRSRAETMANAL